VNRCSEVALMTCYRCFHNRKPLRNPLGRRRCDDQRIITHNPSKLNRLSLIAARGRAAAGGLHAFAWAPA